MHRFVFVAGFVLSVALRAAARQPAVLTFEEAITRARASAPAVVAARMRIDETRARVIGASLPLATNPTMDVEAGRRTGAATTTDYGIALAQDFELPARRRARIDSARAGVTQEEQRAREIEREVLREVATTFLRAVEARERAGTAASGKQLADEALQIAQRRFNAGDVAQLDVNVARTAIARAEVEERAAEALLIGQVTRLKGLLGIAAAEPITIGGSLRDALPVSADELIASAAERADVRVLDAEIEEAEAEQRLAKTLRWPELGLRASYQREGDERVTLGGVGLSLPFFNRGQEATALATARLARLHAERTALKLAIEADVRGALASHEALRAASEQYERTVLPLIEENERLALESYDVGQIGLAELLIVRRDALDARRAFIDQLIETRLAEVELHARAGVWK
ncbi:MAG TPA: TolC family protein [Thermoanaerobaculia bacterium]|nr:TolC family protein [Thermoanaerobaculia bacterium]